MTRSRHNKALPAASANPVPPPLPNFAMVDTSTGKLTPMGYNFMTQFWAGLQGSGGATDNIKALQAQIAIIFGMHGDATLSADGIITVVSSEGRIFVASAFIDTTNAVNITSGILDPARLPIATTLAIGAVKPDGTSITIDPDGTIHSTGGGGGGATIPDIMSRVWVGV